MDNSNLELRGGGKGSSSSGFPEMCDMKHSCMKTMLRMSFVYNVFEKNKKQEHLPNLTRNNVNKFKKPNDINLNISNISESYCSSLSFTCNNESHVFKERFGMLERWCRSSAFTT